MTLNEYIKSKRGNAKALADKLGIHKTIISQIAHDSTSTSPARCVAIEQATDGQVTRKDLRPKDWAEIWPELAAPYCCKTAAKRQSKSARG